MGHSQAEKARSRQRILDAAAGKIREAGLESLSIAELMKAAELTHGGFYGHFPSRAALIEAALERAMDSGAETYAAGVAAAAAKPARGRSPLKTFLNNYLSPANRDDRAISCAFASLAGDVGRSGDPAVRALMAARLEKNFSSMAKTMGSGRGAETAALAAWSTMVGAITLSRLFDEPRSSEILQAARQAVLDLAAGLPREAKDETQPPRAT